MTKTFVPFKVDPIRSLEGGPAKYAESHYAPFRHGSVLFGATAVFSQADVSTATLKGTITDQSGGRIADAVVVATDTEHGTRRESTTDSLGAYQIPFLVPSGYSVRVEKPGFETQLFKGIQLTVGQIAVLDAALKVGTVSTEVAVNTDAPLVEVEKTQQANTINTLQVQNLPNITRNFFAPVYTLPGVSSSTAPRAQGNGAFNFGTSGFSIGGSNGRSNLITVDGGENEFGDGEPRYLMSPEVVQEFQVNRNAFGAEFVGNDPKYLFGPFNLRGDRNVPSTSPLGFTAAGDPRRIQFAVKLAF